MKKSLFFALVLVVFASCKSHVGFVTKLPKQEICDVQCIPPVCDIRLIDKHDIGERNDSLSNLAVQHVEDFLCQQNKIDITNTIYIDDTIIQRKINNEVRQVMEIALKNISLDTLKIRELTTIDSILSEQGKRFALLVYQTGFIRYERNWGRIFAQAFDYYIGYYYGDKYEEEHSFMQLIIYDAMNKNLAFYNCHHMPEHNPSEAYVVKEHFKQLYRIYWQ